MTQSDWLDSNPARAARAMTPEQRAALPPRRGFVFVGRVSLDLVMTGGPGWRSVWEALHEPGDLDSWLAEGPLAVRGERGAALADAADLAAARALREALHELVLALLDRRLPAAEHVEAIDAAAAVAPLVPRVEPESGARTWWRPSARAALSDVARDALELLADRERWERLRVCASDDCGVLFYDDSRPGRRRWCSTVRCGDRQRARRYRARKREG